MTDDYHRKNIHGLLTRGFTEEGPRIDLCFHKSDFQPARNILSNGWCCSRGLIGIQKRPSSNDRTALLKFLHKSQRPSRLNIEY